MLQHVGYCFISQTLFGAKTSRHMWVSTFGGSRIIGIYRRALISQSVRVQASDSRYAQRGKWILAQIFHKANSKITKGIRVRGHLEPRVSATKVAKIRNDLLKNTIWKNLIIFRMQPNILRMFFNLLQGMRMYGFFHSPMGKITFKDLDMAMLYDPLERKVTVHYVYYNTLQLNEINFFKSHFNSTVVPLTRTFSIFYSSLFQQYFI